MTEPYANIRQALAMRPTMLPNDYSRCQGALMEVPEEVSQHRLDMHPSVCTACTG